MFAIATRAGSPHRAFIDIEKILKKRGKHLDAYFTLNMGNNAFVPIPTKEEIAELESVVQNRLDLIQQSIIIKKKLGKRHPQYDSSSFCLCSAPTHSFIYGSC